MDNSQSHGDPNMSFSHIPRDPTTLPSSVTNVSSLNQALVSHLTPALGSRTSFRNEGPYRLTDSPPTLLDANGNARPNQAVRASSPHQAFAVSLTANDSRATNGVKRKHTEGPSPLPTPAASSQTGKRRREVDDLADFDGDPAHGSKHWTEEEKSQLFTWLMGEGQDDHWNSLRTAKNSCFRKCATEVFGGKKTYQALKGCYERNFNLFKTIHAFEPFLFPAGNQVVTTANENDRLREYDRRIQIARRANCDPGNISARIIDHWHRTGWYELFRKRWEGDPAATRLPNNNRVPVSGGSGLAASTASAAELDDDDRSSDTAEATPNQASMQNAQPNPLTPPLSRPANPGATTSTVPVRMSVPVPDLTQFDLLSASSSGRSLATNHIGLPPPPTEQSSSINVAVPNNLLAACVQLLQAQVQHSKVKLDYLRRREEREEQESQARREMERTRLDREQAEWEHNKESLKMKQRAQLATEILSNPVVDVSVRQAAVDYLKKLFVAD